MLHSANERMNSNLPHENSEICSACSTWVGPVAALALLLHFLPTQDLFAGDTKPQYSASGRIEVVTRTTPLDQALTNRTDFYVEVSEGRYKVRITPLGTTNQYYEYAFDNGAMTVLHHVSPAAGHIAATPGSNVPAMFPARIELRESPPNDGTRAQFVWLALASQNYFATARSHLLPIWFPEDPKTRRQPFEMQIYYDVLDRAPHLLSRLVFLSDGFYRSYNPARRSVDVLQLVPPFDRGFTNAVYQVLALTNNSGHVLPKEFLFVAYSSPVGLGEIPFERLMVHGTVDETSDLVRDSAQIAGFAGTASVVDFRISGTLKRAGEISQYHYAAYPVTNAQWLASNQLPEIRHRVENNILQQPIRNPSPSRAVLVRILVAGIAFGALPIFWRLCRRKAKP